VAAQGIGFAISTGTIKRITAQLVQNGRAIHPYIGVRYVPLTPAIAAELGTSTREGVAIAAVVPGSPADRAGLRPRDIVTRANGSALKGDSAFAQALDDRKPGDTVTLMVERGGRTQELKVTLGEAPPP
jgi:serine protease Do